MTTIEEAKSLVCELCQGLYAGGHVSGTGGGVSVRVGDAIVMAPSGVQKERMRPEDMFVLETDGSVREAPSGARCLSRPREPAPGDPEPAPRAAKLSECAPIFQAAFDLRGAGAVIHSHSLNAVMATLLDPDASEFRVTQLEMIKGIAGHGFFSPLVVPIVENTAREAELTDRMRAALEAYPNTQAVLVRRHGVYIWGADWIQAKTQAECYEYLFEAAVRLRTLGIDASTPAGPKKLARENGHANGHANDDSTDGSAASANGVASAIPISKRLRPARLPKAVVLDIEGTVAPISFVADVLFPYADVRRVRAHLEASYETEETQADIQLLREQALLDAKELGAGAAAPFESPPVPEASAGKDAVVAAAASAVEAASAAGRKTRGLKAVQGRVWRHGYAAGELRADLFRDVPDALVAWRDAGIKTYIYSSGSREAQRLLFGNTTAGDLRPYLSGFFDTTVGAKVEARSYREIAESLGVDRPSEIIFATDVLAEARAAGEAGWRAVLIARPGNAPLPEGAGGFPVLGTVDRLLDAYDA